MATTTFNNTMVIYIPRMNTFWGTKNKITEVFHNQDIGKVFRVDIIKKKVPDERKAKRTHIGGDYIRSAHVYLNWYNTEANHNLQARIFNPEKEARVVFDDPWYWLLLESNRNQDEQRIQQIESNVNIIANTISNQNKETKAQLKKQNEAIQRLQDFCITHGLEIPFWDMRNPPAEEVSSMETLAANTAANVAEFVLSNEEENKLYDYNSVNIHNNADYIPLPNYDDDEYYLYPNINESNKYYERDMNIRYRQEDEYEEDYVEEEEEDEKGYYGY